MKVHEGAMYEPNASESHGGTEGSAVNDTEAGWSPTVEDHESQETDVALSSINPNFAYASPPDGSPSAQSLDEPPHLNCASKPAYGSKSATENTPEVSISVDPRPSERENGSGLNKTPAHYKLSDNSRQTDGAVEISFVTSRHDFMNWPLRNSDATFSVDQLPKPVVINCDLSEAGHQQTAATLQSDHLRFVEGQPSSENGDTINHGPPTESKVPVDQNGSDTKNAPTIKASVRPNRWRSFRNSFDDNSLSVQSSIINDTESYVLTLGRKASAWVSNETYTHDSSQQQHRQQQQHQQQQHHGTVSDPAEKPPNPHKKRCFSLGKNVLWVLVAIFLVALSPLIMIAYGIYALISCIACPKERQNDTVT